MKKIVAAATALAVAAITLSACAKTTELVAPAAAPAASSTPSTSEPGNFPTPDPADLTPTEEPTTEDTVTEGKFGDTGSFTQEDVTFTVKVAKGVKAKCHYSSIGCDKPETGDRIINVPITVKNTGSSALEVSESMFVIEFADGTRMESSDGPTHQYGPDNTLSYEQKVRPGGTLKTSLTFEAPNGAYSIVMLTSSYGGEDLYIWK